MSTALRRGGGDREVVPAAKDMLQGQDAEAVPVTREQFGALQEIDTGGA